MRFLLLSDSKGKDNGINRKVLSKLLIESCKLTPNIEYIILGGDNIAGSKKEKEVTNQLQNLRSLVAKYYPRAPLIPVVGNHEVNNEPEDDSFEKIFSIFYKDMLPDSELRDYNKTVYHVDFEDTRLIILNSFHFNEIHKISKKQLLWFKEAASADIRNKLVFVHSPAFPTGAHYGNCLDSFPEHRDAFWKLVNDNNIDIVFSGHEHNYSRREINYGKNIYQVITGGCGEKLKDKFKDKNGIVIAPIAKFHFVVIDITIRGIEVYAISSKGELIDKFKVDK